MYQNAAQRTSTDMSVWHASIGKHGGHAMLKIRKRDKEGIMELAILVGGMAIAGLIHIILGG